ncbi:hypothetical protein [Janibacter melonis]|uniref:hypothetical protein n=1 Tax=Janibacter melonis TaxID=262209 RepID=UPI000AB9FA9C|nr:hypothetical protein [Janibacter melonis]
MRQQEQKKFPTIMRIVLQNPVGPKTYLGIEELLAGPEGPRQALLNVAGVFRALRPPPSGILPWGSL